MEIKVMNLKKSFARKVVIQDFSYQFSAGKIYAIYGESGKGKTTLLNLIGKIDKQSDGVIDYILKGKRITNSTILRRYYLSYILQNYGLVNNETVENNLKYALKYTKLSRKQKEIKINQLCESVGIIALLKQPIYTLSGGEQQRVAIARAILKPSSVILADEPTGNLDDDNAAVIYELILMLKKMGKCVIIVTHDHKVKSIADEVITI